MTQFQSRVNNTKILFRLDFDPRIQSNFDNWRLFMNQMEFGKYEYITILFKDHHGRTIIENTSNKYLPMTVEHYVGLMETDRIKTQKAIWIE